MPTQMFQTSLSAFQTWQRCEQQYEYSYVRHLRRRDAFAAPTLGRVLHEYISTYYTLIGSELEPEEAHGQSQLLTSVKYTEPIRGYANAAFLAGSLDLAAELQAIPKVAARLSDRYFAIRGRGDADRYRVVVATSKKILLNEAPLKIRLTPTIQSNGVVDLVTQDQLDGRIGIWENKSTTSVPDDSVRLRDFQTLLYGEKLRIAYGVEADYVLWNYLRTKPPTEPHILKAGTVSKDKSMDTTWEAYKEAIQKSNELDETTPGPDSPFYDEVRERLEGREEAVWFPRYEQIIVAEASVLMRDYIEESRRMRTARAAWASGKLQPIRTFMRDCNGCEFFLLCKAALTGGDEEDVIRMRFTTSRQT